MKDNVNIIGAGLAGLAAAIVLRKHGFPVTVYEQSPDVGHRLNGDFQGLDNWSSQIDITEMLKDIGIEINFLCVPCYKGTVYAPEMNPAEMKSDKPLFYIVKRGTTPGTLDIGLKEQALSLGVEILFNHRLDKFAGCAIVGTGPKGADAIAIGITFNTELDDKAVVALDDNIAPKGYAYLLVNQGYGTMATILYREFRRGDECFDNMMQFFSDNMELDIKLDIKNERKFVGYANFFMRDTQIYHEKLYIGESAGFQDCLWGFGMKHAFLSGYLAAKSFIDGSDYDELWKKELKPMLETSLINRYILEKSGHAGYRHMARKFTERDPHGFLLSQYNHSFLKHLLLPLARRNYESRVKDNNCNHKDCSCVWCMCGDSRACP